MWIKLKLYFTSNSSPKQKFHTAGRANNNAYFIQLELFLYVYRWNTDRLSL